TSSDRHVTNSSAPQGGAVKLPRIPALCRNVSGTDSRFLSERSCDRSKHLVAGWLCHGAVLFDNAAVAADQKLVEIPAHLPLLLREPLIEGVHLTALHLHFRK